MTAVRTYEVLCSWIASATSVDHLICVDNYIENVYYPMYPPKHNVLHVEMFHNMKERILAKQNEINNIPLTIDEPNID
jgi:hypothetical protein